MRAQGREVCVAKVEQRVVLGVELRVRVLLTLQADDAQPLDPAEEKVSALCTGKNVAHGKGVGTDMSARSKLSLNTLVTLRSISRLSVASVRIF